MKANRNTKAKEAKKVTGRNLIKPLKELNELHQLLVQQVKDNMYLHVGRVGVDTAVLNIVDKLTEKVKEVAKIYHQKWLAENFSDEHYQKNFVNHVPNKWDEWCKIKSDIDSRRFRRSYR